MKVTRREFSRLIAVSAGTQLLPGISFAAEDRKIGYCVEGQGRAHGCGIWRTYRQHL
jgi:hypothetical protein